MGGCCILYCRNSTEKGFSMKSFPVSPEKRELWLKMIDRPDWDPGLKSRICEAHFTSEMWEKTESGTKLSQDAVPTIFPKPPTRPKNAEKKIIRRRRNKVSVLSDHAYVNKPAQVEVRLPNLPRVVLALNAEEAVQMKKGPEPKSILQKNVQLKIAEEALFELKNKLKLVSIRIVPSCSEEPTKKIDAQEKNTPELPKILELNANVATQLQRICEAKSNPQKNIQPKNADGNPIESVQNELKLVNGSMFPPCSGEQTKKLIDTQEKKIKLPKVVLKLNANQDIQIQRIREPESLLQQNFEPKVPDGIPIESIQEEFKLVNRPIFPPMTEEQMKKRIDSQGKKILQLKKKLTKLRFADRKLNRQNSLYQTIVRSLFSEDQIELLMSKQMSEKYARSKKWSVSTIEKANNFKSIAGNVGYLELLKLGYPFPSLRTLNREKSKLSKWQKSSSPTSGDISRNVSKNLSKNVAKRKVTVPKKINGELIIDGKNPDAEKESQEKRSKTEVES
ncbi:THAP domain-containing protein 5-like [Belonocnema kinseyi]|uniref:THAP domain-containing protein 5-like n=1 Tax=Belonocnema kinseyi TaxID=2817044 RepID=UPI00143CC2E0|nr:THAP domain-containing protein 5-like [Belonocnema kinseyi]